jgi:hypothetical protein
MPDEKPPVAASLSPSFLADPPYHASYYQQPQGMSAALLAELTKPFHQKLLEEAKNSLHAGLHEMAVVLSQAACEMGTEWALTTLLTIRDIKGLAEPLLELFKTTDISNHRLHDVYEALSGDSPNQQPFWSALKIHHARRNGVVHRGQKSSQNEAQESVLVVEQYLIHLDNVVKARQV